MPPSPALLDVQGLRFARNEAIVFGPVDFAVSEGEALLVQGDNGAGIGASHQTGWTALVAKLIQQSGVPAVT